MHLLLQRR
ncbi:hypothetical protein ACHAWC_003306 [Mediolabrus comicus]